MGATTQSSSRATPSRRTAVPSGRAAHRCRVRGCACEDARTLRTWANGVTLLRTVASLALVLPAATTRSWPLLVAAYAVYWLGDVADGVVARRLHQETRAGAVLDIVCDRVNTTTCLLTVLLLVPDAGAPIGVFLVQFVVVDLVLSLLPLRWPVLSPNYFDLVDPLVHRLNWRPLAKATNTTLLAVLVVFVPDLRVALVAALAVLAVKVFSLGRVLLLLRAPDRRPARRPAAHHVDVPVTDGPVVPESEGRGPVVPEPEGRGPVVREPVVRGPVGRDAVLPAHGG